MRHADSETQSLYSGESAPARARTAGAAEPIFLAGEVIANRFRVVRLLGQGGMAQVFQAEDLELGQDVAIKVIRPELAASRRARELLRREVLLARRVTHPNACRIFDVFHHQPVQRAAAEPAGVDAAEPAPRGILLLAMELLRGETLARRLAAGGPLTAAEAMPLVRQLGEALDAAHRSQVVHGDFKSANVILEQTARGPRAVVTDFGLAQQASMTTPCAGGTSAYMAPERLASLHEEGRWSDAEEVTARLGVLLRQAIGIPDPLPEDRAAMRAMQPATLEAEGLLAQGVAQLERGEAVEASSLLGRALRTDEDFAPTQAALARAHLELGDGRRARREAEHAARQPSHLPERQRLEIAAVAKQASGDLAGAEGMLRALWRLAPHHLDYGMQLAETQLAADQSAAALDTVRRLASADGLDDELRARADLVTARARAMRAELPEARAAAVAAASRARRTGAVSLVAAARLAEADVRAEDGDSARASAALAEARAIYRRLGFRAGEGEVLYRLADLAARGGQAGQALQLNDAALAIFDATGHTRGSALVTMAIGRYWQSRYELQRARPLLERALAAFRSLGDRAGEALALNSLSFVAFDSGDYARAEKLLEEEVGIESGLGDLKGLSRALVNLANDEGMLGDFHAARGHVEEALRLTQGLGNKTGEAFARQNLAALLFAERDLHAAGIELWRTTGCARQANFPYLQRAALGMLGVVLTEERRFRPAEAAFAQALALAGERNDPENEQVLLNLARLELWQGKVGEAEHAIRQAQAIFPGAPPRLDSLVVLAWALTIRGDLAAAQATAERVARLASATSESEKILMAAIGVGRVALASHRSAAAARELEAALRRTLRSPRPDLRYEARLLRDEAWLASSAGCPVSGAAVADLRALVQEARRLRFELIGHEAEQQLAAALSAAGGTGSGAAHHG